MRPRVAPHTCATRCSEAISRRTESTPSVSLTHKDHALLSRANTVASSMAAASAFVSASNKLGPERGARSGSAYQRAWKRGGNCCQWVGEALSASSASRTPPSISHVSRSALKSSSSTLVPAAATSAYALGSEVRVAGTLSASARVASLLALLASTSSPLSPSPSLTPISYLSLPP
eukprot:scaffold180306_cov30-Tisochrysis_lutea.AAC.1